MKIFFLSILALIYITTSSGAELHMHFCMGQLADWGLGQNKSKTCGKCGMDKSEEKNNGCCNDKFKLVKNDADQKTAEAGVKLIQLIASALPVSYIEIQATGFSYIIKEYPVSHAPPRSAGVAVYIRNCTFLI